MNSFAVNAPAKAVKNMQARNALSGRGFLGQSHFYEEAPRLCCCDRWKRNPAFCPFHHGRTC